MIKFGFSLHPPFSHVKLNSMGSMKKKIIDKNFNMFNQSVEEKLLAK